MVGPASLILRTADLATRGILLADKAASHVPYYDRLKGEVLDRLLGPADDTEYVSVTSPNN
jgi:hypothetical protein